MGQERKSKTILGQSVYMVKKLYQIIFLFIFIATSVKAQTIPPRYCGMDSSDRVLVNRVIRSEEADNAAYTRTSSTVTANTTIAPDGTTTADTLIETASTSDHNIRQSFSVTNGVAYRLSAYARAGTRTFAQLATGSGGFGTARYANFNLSTCALGDVGASTTASAVLVGSGWCRMTIEMTASATTSALGFVGIAYAANSPLFVSTLGDGTSGFPVWGMQWNLASDPSTYIRTTDTAVTAGLANTVAQVTERNDIQRSEEFDNAFYTKFNSTITANAGAAPNGANTADRYAETATTTSHAIYNASGITSVSGVSYRHGVFVKPEAGITWVRLAPQYTSALNAWYNISNCTVGTVNTGITARAVSVGNGWCYIEAIRAADNTSSFWQLYSQQSDGQTTSFLGSISNTMLVWGALLNPAASPPDYIPTTSAAATLSGVCPAGTSQSLNDPSRCFPVVVTGRKYNL